MPTRRNVLSSLITTAAWMRAAPAHAEPGQAASPAAAQIVGAQPSGYRLRYSSPAASFGQGFPIGNGRFGATIFGGIDRERLGLNEVTLWSGEPTDWNNPGAKAVLPEVRRLLFEGKNKDAEELCYKMQGPYNQAYLPMGDLFITFEHGAPAASTAYMKYSRGLDLKTAISSVGYQFGGVEYKREFFASFPDKVIVIQLTAAKPGHISFSARMDSLLHYRTVAEGDTYVLKGKAPRNVEQNTKDRDFPVSYADTDSGPGMNFECHLRAIAKGGKVWTDADGLHVQAADEATLLLCGATSWNGNGKSPSKQGRDPRPIARGALDTAGRKTYQQLRDAHLKDYQPLFNRVELYLGKPLDEINMGTAGGGGRGGGGGPAQGDRRDPATIPLMFQYSRYRMIASSREGGQPMTLGAGMWSELVRPGWQNNYTLNENTEKMYAGVEACNLTECAGPYIDFVEDLSANGRKTAEVNYGCRGWVAHHNADGWRQSSPVGRYGQFRESRPTWANWPMGGVWLCENLYNHYTFNGDTEFLRKRGYPIMKSAAEFCLDWLIEDPKTKYLVTAPSVSPENAYFLSDGRECDVSIATACDMSLIWELFKNTIEASRILGVDADFRAKLEAAQKRLYPLKIGSKGQILEWYEEYKEIEPQHRHASLLVGLGWGTRITKRGTPELFAAARKTLELRGPGGGMPQKLVMSARLEDGELAYQNLDTTLNLSEVFIQSHLKEIHLLPALPKGFPEGHFRGLRARGGYVVDVAWREGRLSKSTIRSKFAGTCRVRASVPLAITAAGRSVPFTTPEESVVEFDTTSDGVYELARRS